MDFLRITEDSELCKPSLETRNLGLEELRIKRFSTLIADFVIDEKGDVDLKKAEEVIEKFQIKSYGAFDKEFPRHVKNVLLLFFQKKHQLKLKQLSLPLANPYVDRLFELSLANKKNLEKRDLSRVFLEALLVFLRQIVGSCFATSSIIYAQTSDTELLLNDLFDLVTKGYLKRVIDGVEIKVPISKKTSENFSTESLILRTYEYTAASFADWKTEFYKWNVYSALGLDTTDDFGIGECLYSLIDSKINKINEELEKLREIAFIAEDRLKMNELYLKSATSYEQAKRLDREASVQSHNYHITLSSFNEKKRDGENLHNFYKEFIEELKKLFTVYFQEVFDPDMKVNHEEILEDSKAGFRLLFKHGKSDVDAWNLIYSEEEYVASLLEFFKLIEIDLKYKFDFKGSKELIEELIDKVILRIEDPLFIKKATERTNEIRKKTKTENPINRPWCYVSGGNLESFATCYFSLKNKLQKVVFNPETPSELLSSLIEYMKDLPYTESKPFEENSLKSILMTNEVHAFLFRPGLEKFLKAWSDRGNTYTYIRDVDGIIPFADTNWASDLFAFVKSDKTGEYELARLNTFGVAPLPAHWKNYFSKEKSWTLWFMQTRPQNIQKFV
jgi:hypothetical protein